MTPTIGSLGRAAMTAREAELVAENERLQRMIDAWDANRPRVSRDHNVVPTPVPPAWHTSMLRSAVVNATPMRPDVDVYRWVCVKTALQTTRTAAERLCRDFGVNPMEMLRRERTFGEGG